jgi:hypothetical protein
LVLAFTESELAAAVLVGSVLLPISNAMVITTKIKPEK